MGTDAISAPIQQAPQAQQPTNSNDALRGLELADFLKLMITELQNQDPLSPLENTQILQQISQIREIESSSQLNNTLEAVLLGQNLSSASSLIGKEIRGLSDDGERIEGIVDRVSVTDGKPKLHVGDKDVGLRNISEILSPA